MKVEMILAVSQIGKKDNCVFSSGVASPQMSFGVRLSRIHLSVWEK